MSRCGVASLVLLLTIFSLNPTRAQTLDARISVLSLSPARLKIEGQRAAQTRAWSFLNTYAGVMRLGERIQNLTLADANGVNVQVRQLAPAEYEAASAATRFSYEVKLDPLTDMADGSHVSWLAGTRGFLMLGDLLPRTDKSNGANISNATVRFSLPEQWTIASNETKGANGQFALTEMESAVFFVGQDLRLSRKRIGPMELNFVTAGEWAFTDEDITSLAGNIIQYYAEKTGGVPRSSAMLMLSPFPGPASAERWSAETRGATVALLSGRSPSKLAGLAQLSIPLTHELFHLWTPNGLALDGNYDWFYEGFTMYQAMRAGMQLNYLTFQDYLNTLGRAFDIYRSAPTRDQLSLLDASARRWSVTPALVYNKGMLVAFLYDLQLRLQTDGKHSLDEVYRDLFRRYHGTANRTDGNAAVIAALNATGGMQDFTRRYIEGANAIDLESAITMFGLRVDHGGIRTRIVVADSLSRSQRDLLRKFGYNNTAQRAQNRVRK